jgi:hypothetical protein
MFGSTWNKAEATIVARNTKYSGDGSVSTHEFVADVRLPNEAPFRATIHEPTIATDFWPPNIGDIVSVLVKDKDQKVKFDKDDDRLSAKAFESKKNQAFEAAKHRPVGQPGTPIPSYVPTAMPPAIAERLAQLGSNAGQPMPVFTADAAQAQALFAAFGQTAPGAYGQPMPPVPPVDADPAARLAKLQALRDSGLLSDAEFATQRQRILDAI